MKRGCLTHPKTRSLAKELGITRRDAIGMLTLLWDFTGEYSPDGQIGRFSDEEIAAAVEWPEADAEKLITALVKVRFLDKISKKSGRLLIHDWFDHCEQFVVKRLERQGKTVPSRRDTVRTASGQHPDDGKPTLPTPNPTPPQANAKANPEPTPSPTPSPSPDTEAPTAEGDKGEGSQGDFSSKNGEGEGGGAYGEIQGGEGACAPPANLNGNGHASLNGNGSSNGAEPKSWEYLAALGILHTDSDQGIVVHNKSREWVVDFGGGWVRKESAGSNYTLESPPGPYRDTLARKIASLAMLHPPMTGSSKVGPMASTMGPIRRQFLHDSTGDTELDRMGIRTRMMERLRDLGISEGNSKKLSQKKYLTMEIIEAENRLVRESKNVDDPAAVLATRLAEKSLIQCLHVGGELEGRG